MPRKGELQFLTVCRGLAAWWVVIYHFRELLPNDLPGWFTRFFDQGFLAVDFFFVLSGFVIALSYSQTLRASPESLWTFYINRLARIYPLHIVLLVAFLSVPLAIALFSSRGYEPENFDWSYYILSIFLVQNWGFSGPLSWNVPAWSISTEFGSYLVFPLFLFLGLRRIKTVRASLLVIAALCAILAAIAPLFGSSIGSNIERFGLIRCVLEFLMGAALFWAVHLGLDDQRIARTALNLVAAGLLALFALGWVADYVALPAVFVALIYNAYRHDGAMPRLLREGPLYQLGLVSYSTYLSHYLVKIWINFLVIDLLGENWKTLVVYILVTVVLSFVLYRWIERPAQLLLRSKARMPIRPVLERTSGSA